MKLSRRSFIGLTTVFAGVGGLLFSLFGAKPANEIKAKIKYTPVLTSYLDTLIPKEGDFISASDAGVVAAFLDKADLDVKYGDLLKRGCSWLEMVSQKQHGKSFVSLNELQRIDIITLAERSWINKPSIRNLPGYFFNKTRQDGYSFYYQHPLSWHALNYQGPPQPNGFPDYSTFVNKQNENV